jgi:3-deoxy-manno-octulosonate cytidylyltransferase (CMP-KDO synthetase)
MSSKKFCIVIPARLESSRVPGKVLKKIGEYTMIEQVVRQCLKVPDVDTIVVSDADEVLTVLKNYSIQTIKTGKCNSGTERIVSVLKDLSEYEYIINVQGDQPFVSPDLIISSFQFAQNIQAEKFLVTPICPLDYENALRPSCVKTIVDLNNRAIYFSRSLIPYTNSEANSTEKILPYYGHHGIYLYNFAALAAYPDLKIGQLEQRENLEQLRFIENGIPIYTVFTSEFHLSVDTPEDYEYALEYYRTYLGSLNCCL